MYLKETGKDTMELAVMGVQEKHHRQGIGRSLFEQAKKEAARLGYSFLQVKTVQMGKYESYDRTNRFYLSLGFQELEVLPTLWDEWNRVRFISWLWKNGIFPEKIVPSPARK